jgi:SnoaL-like domain
LQEGRSWGSTGYEISPGSNDRKERDMSDAIELLRINLHEVTSERDPERRLAAIERAYVEDLRFLDSEVDVVGRQAFSDRVQEILDGAPADFVLEEDGPAYAGPDTAAQPWRFGPPGHPVIRGMDVLTLRDGMVSIVRGLVAG